MPQSLAENATAGNFLPRATPDSIDRVRRNAPAELLALPNWVAGDRRPNTSKPDRSSKVPLDPRTGRNAKSTDSTTWAPFEAAAAFALQDDRCFGVGVNLLGTDLIGLDLDHVLSADGSLRPGARDLLDALSPTYTEVSPSGDGLRVFLRGSKPEGIGAMRADAFGPGTKLEVYDRNGGRYLTTTGNVYGERHEIADATDDDLEALAVAMRKRKPKTEQATTVPKAPAPLHENDDLERAPLALSVLDAGMPYPDWLRVGAALRHLGDDGLRLWRTWSQASAKYHDGDCDSRWPGLNGSGFACLVGMANDADPTWQDGYREQRRQQVPPMDLSGLTCHGEPIGKAKAAATTFRVLDAEEVAELPSPDYIVDGWLQEHALVLLAGESGTGKSLVALDLSNRIRHGLRFRDREVRPGAVLYLAGEGFTGLGVRQRAWTAQNNAGRPLHPLRIADGVPNLSRPAGHAMLEALLQQFETERGELPAVTVVDTLSQAFGDGDENDAKTVAPCLRALSDLRTQYGTTFLILHHLNKPPQDGPRKLSLRAVRGSSAFVANVDVVLGLVGTETRRLEALKVKDGEIPPPERLEVVGIETGRSLRNGKPERGAIVIPAAPETVADNATDNVRLVRQALDAAGQEGATRNQLSAATGLAPATLWPILSRMLEGAEPEVHALKEGNRWRYFAAAVVPTVGGTVGELSADSSTDKPPSLTTDLSNCRTVGAFRHDSSSTTVVRRQKRRPKKRAKRKAGAA